MAWWVMTCSTCASREGFQREEEANIRAAGHAQENPNHSVKVETAGMPKFFGAIEEGFEAVFGIVVRLVLVFVVLYAMRRSP